MLPLLFGWVGVTVLMLILVFVRRRLEARESDWIPITTGGPSDIQQQVTIEKKVHALTPVIHWVEALDVLLLLALAALWIYNGIFTPVKPAL